AGQASPDAMPREVQQQVDALARQRLEQAFGSVFGKVLLATERAANTAEAQAAVVKQDQQDELKTWREWQFQFLTWLSAHDAKFSEDLAGIDPEIAEDHALMDEAKVQRSQMLFGILVSLLRGRPLLLVKGLEKERAGFEAMRLLRREMEPKERPRALAIMRQLAGWTFYGNLHEQLMQFEEAVSSYEAVNTPWSTSLSVRGTPKEHASGGPQPMDVDQVWTKGKGKDGKGEKGDKGKGKGGTGKDGKGKKRDKRQSQRKEPWLDQWNQQGGRGQWKQQGQNQWNQQGRQGQWKQQRGAGKGKGKCHTCGQSGTLEVGMPFQWQG
ncbi:dcl1, partial [Symbiodinium sp. CCMP2456]